MLWELVLGLYGSRRAGQLVPAAEGKKMKEKNQGEGATAGLWFWEPREGDRGGRCAVEFDVGMALGLVCVLAKERAETGRWSPVFCAPWCSFSQGKGQALAGFGRRKIRRGRGFCRGFGSPFSLAKGGGSLVREKKIKI